MNDISALIKDLTELPGSLHHMRTEQEGTSYEPGRGPSPECDYLDMLFSDFCSPEL